MKKAMMIFLLILNIEARANNCLETARTEKQEYAVNADIPKYLQGASITVTLADGRSSTVPAEEFMVVKRKATYVVGHAIHTSKVCSGYKNNLIAEVKKGYTGVSKATKSSSSSQQIKVYSEQEFVPGLNYYRENILDSRFGLGIGIDTEGTVKGLIGVDF